MGNTTIAILVLDKFESQLRKDLIEVGQRPLVHDASQLANKAHSLKGSAAAVAAIGLQRMAANLESLARHNEIASIAAELAGLQTEIGRCLGYIPTAKAELRKADERRVSTESPL
ncbi:MAG: Hpt domain-containing protein [Phycisphaeraceae bacterium]|nr:Hpt domain-containing protein [Phycisphaeraceae bacterium]